MSINITTDNNTVTVASTTTNRVNIVDNGNNTTVSVSQPTTQVIKVATVGPQGPSGTAFPYTGSAQILGSLGITGSLSQGINTIASGAYSHAEGSSNTARGYSSHAEGWNTSANGIYSHAEGYSTMALGASSHAEGFTTIAAGDYQHVQGQYNISSSAQSAFIIGNGTSNSTRSNLLFASGSVVEITGSLIVSGSSTFTNIGPAIFSGSITSTQGFTGSLQGTASIALTASYALNAGTAINTGSFATTGSNSFTGSQYIQGDGTFSGALTLGSGYALSFADLGQTPYAWIEGSSYDASFSFIKFMAGGNEAFRITSAGRLGIGKSVPNATLDITGSAIVTGSFLNTGSSTFIGPQVVTGSTRGNVTALSISLNTASIDLSVGNFFTLQLVSGSNTYINPSNILPGQTSILTLSTTGSATVSWPSFVKQPSGSTYVPTTTTGIDIVTLASVDASTLYVVSTKNMI